MKITVLDLEIQPGYVLDERVLAQDGLETGEGVPPVAEERELVAARDPGKTGGDSPLLEKELGEHAEAEEAVPVHPEGPGAGAQLHREGAGRKKQGETQVQLQRQGAGREQARPQREGAEQEQSEGEGAQPHRKGAGQKRGALQAVERKKHSQQTEAGQKQGEGPKKSNQLLEVEPGQESSTSTHPSLVEQKRSHLDHFSWQGCLAQSNQRYREQLRLEVHWPTLDWRLHPLDWKELKAVQMTMGLGYQRRCCTQHPYSTGIVPPR